MKIEYICLGLVIFSFIQWFLLYAQSRLIKQGDRIIKMMWKSISVNQESLIKTLQDVDNRNGNTQ